MVSSDVGELFDPNGMSEQPVSKALFEHRALHADESFSMAMSLCRQAMLGPSGIHHLAYYAGGVYDFAMDILADVTSDFDRSVGSIESRRSNYERVGCQLSNEVRDLDRTLQALCTGALIRTVLHSSRGVICCNLVVPNEYVVGLSFDAPAPLPSDVPLPELPSAKQLDIDLAQLATALRRQLSLQSLNPGSWISPKPARNKTGSDQHPEFPAAQDSSLYIEGDKDSNMTELFLAEVHPEDLHYLAYCRDGEIILSVDQLGHRQLSLYFTQITVEKRRSLYHDFCRQLPVIVGKLGKMVSSAIGGRLDRVVLDVEQGAIYYYRVRTGEYLVGVTIDQGMVAEVDRKVARLTLSLSKQ